MTPLRSKYVLFFFLGILLTLKEDLAWTQPVQLLPPQAPTSAPAPSQPSSFWEGTPPSVVETYLSDLPQVLLSPTLRALRGLILQESYPPLQNNEIYEKKIFELLLATGAFDQAQTVLGEGHISSIEAHLLDVFWLAKETKKACEKVENLLRGSPTFALKEQNIYCLYKRGEEGRAKIAYELLRETKPDLSPTIGGLFDSSQKPAFTPEMGKSPFLFTLWCEGGQPLAQAELNTLSPAYLAFMARSETLPEATRLLAGEKAFALGSLTREELLSLLQAASGEQTIVKLYKAAQALDRQALLSLLKENPTPVLMVSLLSPLLEKLTPQEDSLALAPFLIKGFLYGGNAGPAQTWFSIYRREKPDEAIGLLPLMHLASREVKWGDDQLQAWQAYQARVYPSRAHLASYELRHLLKAIGEPLGPVLKGEPPPPSWRQEKGLFDEKTVTLLHGAMQGNRRGEVLLLVLSQVKATSLSELVPDKFIRLVAGLHKVGYVQEARALALEYLLEKQEF